jgi:hypothetical protein
MNTTFNRRLERANKIVRFIDEIERKSPQLARQLQLMDKVGMPEADTKMSSGKSATVEEDKKLQHEQKGFFGRFGGAKETEQKQPQQPAPVAVAASPPVSPPASQTVASSTPVAAQTPADQPASSQPAEQKSAEPKPAA